MFGTNRNPAQAYARVGLETGVAAASPHKLIAMLFDGALIAIRKAEQHMLAGEIAEKGAAISKAMSIVDSGLRSVLNLKEGGDLAQNLNALYVYIYERLAQAHLKNDPALLQEAYKLLAELKSAWDQIGPQGQAVAPVSPTTSAALV